MQWEELDKYAITIHTELMNALSSIMESYPKSTLDLNGSLFSFKEHTREN